MAKPDDKTGPTPPQNLDAEENVLGAMMLSTFAIDACIDVVDAKDFYRESHGKIFAACVTLYENGDPVDAITVADHLASTGTLEQVGGKERLHEIATLVASTANARHYAGIVREMSLLRSLTVTGEKVQRLGWERDGSAAEAVERAEALIFEMTSERTGTDFVTSEVVASEVLDRMEELARQGTSIVGLPTGFRDLDQMTAGLQPGNLVIVAGRPSMGKTAFALGVSANVTLRHGEPVALFTFEMNRWEVMQRIISSEALVTSEHVRTPSRMTGDEWKKITVAAGKIAAAPLFIQDVGGSLLELRAKTRRLKTRNPALALVIVDYVQLMGHGGGRTENRNLEISDISRGLKLLAGELQIPIMLLSQLSRRVEERHDKRPMLSDLRDSGALEQDADVVMLLYRDEYYYPEEETNQGIAEVDIAKQRNGPVGMKKLSFVNRYARFSDLAHGPVGGGGEYR